MNEKLDQWSLSYYEGALSGMQEEVASLSEYADDLAEEIRNLERRFFQFKELFKHIAASTWQPMETVPKDGTAILLKFKSGFYQVCYWDSWETARDPANGDKPGRESSWVINGDSVAVIMEEPIAWAEIV